MTKLYIVEGLPCTGKSTASKYLADGLTARGKNVVYVDEGSGDHPADYEFSAYLTGSELAAFPPGLRERVRVCAEAWRDGYVVPLSPFGGVALDWLLPYKIYDSLPWEVEMPLMLDKWKSFTESAEPNTFYVFNCVLLQNPMCETMLRFNFPLERSQEYISQIAELIAPLEPSVIYLQNDEIAETIQRTAEERGDWLDSMIAYHESGGYGKSVNARGLEGLAACLEERQRRELAVLAELPVRSLVLDNPQRDWRAAYGQMLSFIGL